MLAAPERLSPAGRRLVVSPEHELFFSAASAWEIAIKHGLGTLTLPGAPAELVPEWMTRTGVTPLAVAGGPGAARGADDPHGGSGV